MAQVLLLYYLFRGEEVEYLLQVLLSFIAVACFAILFNAPRSLIVHSGCVGVIGWMIYYFFTAHHTNPIAATFLGAFVVAIGSNVLARKLRVPMIVFNVAGIIPLVPGGTAYSAMRSAVENDYLMTIQYGVKAFIISGAIVMGLVFAEVMMQLFIRLWRNGKTGSMTTVERK